jgi:hypothetical protein
MILGSAVSESRVPGTNGYDGHVAVQKLRKSTSASLWRTTPKVRLFIRKIFRSCQALKYSSSSHDAFRVLWKIYVFLITFKSLTLCGRSIVPLLFRIGSGCVADPSLLSQILIMRHAPLAISGSIDGSIGRLRISRHILSYA